MTTWTPPERTDLSGAEIDHVVVGLGEKNSRDAALAFLGQLTDAGLLYVIAVKVGHPDRPRAGASADGLRNFIRNRVRRPRHFPGCADRA